MFGEKGKSSCMKKIRNLVINNDCLGQLDYDSLTQDKSLTFLMFMAKKRNGVIKSRGVADGSHQKLYTEKADFTSPTLFFYSINHIGVAPANDERDVVTVDFQGFSYKLKSMRTRNQ